MQMPPLWPNGNYLYFAVNSHTHTLRRAEQTWALEMYLGNCWGAAQRQLFYAVLFFYFPAFFLFLVGNRLISKSASLISFCSPHLRLVKEFSGAARARKRTAGDC